MEAKHMDAYSVSAAMRVRNVLQQTSQVSWDINSFSKKFPLDGIKTNEELEIILSAYADFLRRIAEIGKQAESVLKQQEEGFRKDGK